MTARLKFSIQGLTCRKMNETESPQSKTIDKSTSNYFDSMKDEKLGITQTSDLEKQTSDSSESHEEIEVKRSLSPRVISMLALGGTIGTGLFISIGTPLQESGPVLSLIAYLFVGSFVYGVIQSIGELATYMPVPGSFTVYNGRMLSESIGFATGYMYWFSWVTALATELSVVGQVIQYWTDSVPLWAWILIFWITLVVINLFPVKYYGEIEFWISLIKIIAIVGFLIYALCMVCGAGKTGPVGFRYWRNPGPWGPGKTSTKRFLAFVNSLVDAMFTYQGTELIGITVGEVKNPKKAVPKAINAVFFRILLFYVGSLFFIGLLVPFSDPSLGIGGTDAASSPFVIAMTNSGTRVLPDIFNAVILTTILSASNSSIYTSSRILHAIAANGACYKIFAKTNKHGVPVSAVLFSSAFGSLAFLVCSDSGNIAFNWLIQITVVAGLYTWLFISVCHLRFIKALKLKGLSRDDLPFKAKFMPWLAIYSAFWVFILIFIQGYAVFLQFDVKTFFINYISVILFVVLWIGHQLITRKAWWIPIEEIDITTGVRKTEDNFLNEEEQQEQEHRTLLNKFFNTVF